MKRSVRYLLAAAASSTGGAGSLTAGLLIGRFAVEHGISNGLAIAVMISIFGTVLIPAFIVKKLLVDYW